MKVILSERKSCFQRESRTFREKVTQLGRKSDNRREEKVRNSNRKSAVRKKVRQSDTKSESNTVLTKVRQQLPPRPSPFLPFPSLSFPWLFSTTLTRPSYLLSYTLCCPLFSSYSPQPLPSPPVFLWMCSCMSYSRRTSLAPLPCVYSFVECIMHECSLGHFRLRRAAVSTIRVVIFMTVIRLAVRGPLCL